MTAQRGERSEQFEFMQAPVDERARATYKHLRDTGLSDTDIMAFAGELLSLVASDVRSQGAAAE